MSERRRLRRRRSLVASALVGVAVATIAACAGKPPPTVSPDAAASVSASADTAPDPSASAAPVASMAPPEPPNDRCVQDSDCTIHDDVVEGPFTCCTGCVDRAISKDGLATFRDACSRHPPEQCPPVGCPRGPVHAVCENTHCVKRLGRAPRPPKTNADCDPGGPTPRTCVAPNRTRGGSPGPNGCRAEPEGGVCRGCRAMFDGVEGGLCCYSGLSRFPRCDR